MILKHGMITRKMLNFDKRLDAMEADKVGAKGKRGGKFCLYNRIVLNCVIRTLASNTVLNVRFRWAGKDSYIDVHIEEKTDMGLRDYTLGVGDRRQVRGYLQDISNCEHQRFVIKAEQIVYVGHNDSRARKGYTPLSEEWKD